VSTSLLLLLLLLFILPQVVLVLPSLLLLPLLALMKVAVAAVSCRSRNSCQCNPVAGACHTDSCITTSACCIPRWCTCHH
jgi:hypothetical protein